MINESWLRMFLEMRKRYHFHGAVLLLGSQDVVFSHDTAEAVFSVVGAPFHPIPEQHRFYKLSKAQKILTTNDRYYMSVKDLFKMMSFEFCEILDAFPNEKPDILHDLNYPIDISYHDKYDLVIDIGTMEHVCDVRQALENVVMMVKTGGCVVLLLPMVTSPMIDSSFYLMNPPFFFDILSANGFNEFSAYINWLSMDSHAMDQRTIWLEYIYGDHVEVCRPSYYTQMMFLGIKVRRQETFVPVLQGFYVRYHSDEENDFGDDVTDGASKKTEQEYEDGEGKMNEGEEYRDRQVAQIVKLPGKDEHEEQPVQEEAEAIEQGPEVIQEPANVVARVYRFVLPTALRRVIYKYRQRVKEYLRSPTTVPVADDAAEDDRAEEQLDRVEPQAEEQSDPLELEKRLHPGREVLYL